MALKFPSNGHPVLDIVTRGQIEALTPDTVYDLPTIADARKEAQRRADEGALVSAKQFGVAAAYNALIRTTDGRVTLVAVWPNGSSKVRWNFGYVEADKCLPHLIVETTHPSDVIE